MKCKSCEHEITEYQHKEYNGYCCDVCNLKTRKYTSDFCCNCGVPLEDNTFGEFCSGGCSGEFAERMS